MKKSFLLLLCLALVATACGGSAEETVEEPVATEEVETLEAPATTAAPTIDKITFGFVPSAEQAELLDNIQPLMKVLSDGLGIEVEGFVTSDYSGLLVLLAVRPHLPCKSVAPAKIDSRQAIATGVSVLSACILFAFRSRFHSGVGKWLVVNYLVALTI